MQSPSAMPSLSIDDDQHSCLTHSLFFILSFIVAGPPSCPPTHRFCHSTTSTTTLSALSKVLKT